MASGEPIRKGGEVVSLIDTVKNGDRVTIVDRFGVEHTGRAVMRSAVGGWVLNMGGKHGTPGLADDLNVVAVKPPRQVR